MKVRTLVGAIALVAVTALVTNAISQDSGAMDEATKRWMEYATPGAEHQAFATMVGKWDLEVSLWMAPGAPPTKSTGTSEMKLAMDGRYLMEHVDATMNMGPGMEMPLKGLAIAGYDNMKKKYISTWLDNMGTGISHFEGTKSGNVLTMEGMTADCHKGEFVKQRHVMTTVDKDTLKFEMFGPGEDGKDVKGMEIVYKRSGAKNAQ